MQSYNVDIDVVAMNYCFMENICVEIIKNNSMLVWNSMCGWVNNEIYSFIIIIIHLNCMYYVLGCICEGYWVWTESSWIVQSFTTTLQSWHQHQIHCLPLPLLCLQLSIHLFFLTWLSVVNALACLLSIQLCGHVYPGMSFTPVEGVPQN